MRAHLLLLAVLSVGCDDSATIELTVAPVPEPVDGMIPYQSGGALTIQVTAKLPGNDDALQTLAADLRLSSTKVAAVTGKATLVRMGTTDTFDGATQLTWPSGGAVTVTARVAGHETSRELTIGMPPTIASVEFVSPPGVAAAGTVVSLSVKVASDPASTGVSGVTVAFSASAELVLLPASAATDASGTAKTTFVMPDLQGSTLLVAATASGRTITTPLTNR